MGVNEHSFWQDRSVFVTGATGLLGSWLVTELVAQGASVVALIRDRIPFSLLYANGLNQKIASVSGDIQDYMLLERTLAEYEVSVVFHLAAQTQVLVANRSPLSTFESNIRGTYLLLEACRKHPLLKAVVVASSDKAYGSSDHLPYDEETPLRGQYPYDASKSCADLISNSYARNFDMPVSVTRCGNLYGGGDLNFARIVPGTIRSVHQGKAPVIRTDGTLIRDYFYVRDAVLAYMMLAERTVTGNRRGDAYNFSSGTPLSVLEITAQILKAMGREDLRPVVLGENRGEIKDQWLGTAKARQELGWEPRFTLQEALSETIDWYRDYFAKTEGTLDRAAVVA
ncbi:MAG TPA: GDP-mannose 4,6-dehydratase [Bryobacteraceae bacterium]|nr:GDP-mannose 4,6-dehydratase [Bryobacteraceae bacterium]